MFAAPLIFRGPGGWRIGLTPKTPSVAASDCGSRMCVWIINVYPLGHGGGIELLVG